jgi:hypothetical protein
VKLVPKQAEVLNTLVDGHQDVLILANKKRIIA